MTGILRNPDDRGYPTEYILSRIKGRRARLISDWRPLVNAVDPFERATGSRGPAVSSTRAPEDAWKSLGREYCWVYAQMNERLRRIFRPYFLYAELRTLFICLRQLEQKKTGTVEEMLNSSLLSEAVRHALLANTDERRAVEEIEVLFARWSPRFTGLTDQYDSDGLRGVEQKLTNTCLVVLMSGQLGRLMEGFFKRMIDARNIMSLYQYIRLEESSLPVLIDGGTISLGRLQVAAASQDLMKVLDLVRVSSGITRDVSDPLRTEISLYRGMTRWMRREGRDPLGEGLILAYLWQCSIEAMNLSVLYHGRNLDRDLLVTELV